MSRQWIFLIPVVSPFMVLLGWYLLAVAPSVFEKAVRGESFLGLVGWKSRYWWHSHFSSDPAYGGRGSIEFLLAVCALAFLVGAIAALVLHLILPRRTAMPHQPERD